MNSTSEVSQDLRVPVVVDLDGTLIKTDTLFESFLVIIKNHPLIIPKLVVLLFVSLSRFKQKIADVVSLDVQYFPYNDKVVDFLKTNHKTGRRLVLASASNRKYVQAVANHLGIFSNVIASDDNCNYKGAKKAKKLIEMYGENGFDYIGDSKSDLEIFPSARNVLLVNPSKSTHRKALKNNNVKEVFRSEVTLMDYLKLIRIHQWLKNILLFLPLIASHNWFNFDLVLRCFVGFFALSIGASGTYILNDLFDLQDDRKHPGKKKRPIANGSVSIGKGAFLSGIMMIAGLLISYFSALHFFYYVVLYIIITLLYSFIFKRYVLADSILLANLFTIRVLAGAELIDVKMSFWLLAFSIFIFFSLALIKRCTELQLLENMGKKESAGRDYSVVDIASLRGMGITSGFMSVLVFAMYINSDTVSLLYSHAEFLWPVCLALLYLVCRLWIKTGRGEMSDDPIVFALKDRTSMLIFVVIVALIVTATYL